MSSVPPSDELALTKEFRQIRFISVRDLKTRVAALQEEVENGGQCQHLAFRPIVQVQFERLDQKGADLGRGITFTWFADIKTLNIEVPGVFHEKAHSEFERALTCLRADAKWWFGAFTGGSEHPDDSMDQAREKGSPDGEVVSWASTSNAVE